jgi:hypothetical protein
MKKLYLGVGLVLGSLLLGGPASAAIGTIDAVPAATLLLPYFEVNLASTDGTNTLFSINNASPMAVLAHVTIWSDQSIPVLTFDVYLTGYDVQSINLRDVLQNGNLPRTASAGQDTAQNTISPQGPLSQDINLTSCAGKLPYTNPALNAAFRAHLQAILQGNPSPTFGTCYGSKTRDNILRGYVTVDTVNACNTLFPSQFSQYDTVLTDQNVLWGNVRYINTGQNMAQGDTLVHIEACSTCFTPGDHTFYGRYNGATAADAREPLPTTMAAVYENGGSFNGGTDFLIWREGGSQASATSYNCNLPGPAEWYPLSFFQVLIFDEQESVMDAEECWYGIPDCTPTVRIPNAANRIDTATNLLTPFNFGWMRLNLQHPAITYPDPYAQMWLTTQMDSTGRFSVGFPAIQLDNANQ